MKRNHLLITTICFAVIFMTSCSSSNELPSAGNAANFDSSRGLKDYYNNYFDIGVAVSPRALNTDEAGLIVKHFNSITAENAMKMGPIHPRENEYSWRGADSIVAFAQRNKLKMRGHTLCWHNQAPSWMFADNSGNPVSKEVLLQRLKDHITAEVSSYNGKIFD